MDGMHEFCSFRLPLSFKDGVCLVVTGARPSPFALGPRLFSRAPGSLETSLPISEKFSRIGFKKSWQVYTTQ